MKFKHKLRLFLFPSLLIPAVVVIAVNFLITRSEIREMEYELLRNKVTHVTDMCASEYQSIVSLNMDHVEYYREATKKLVMEEVKRNTTSNEVITIVDTGSYDIVFSTSRDAQSIFHAQEYLRSMVRQQRGIMESARPSRSGKSRSKMMAFDVYENWNWLVIAHADTSFVYRYVYEAITVSALVVGLVLIVAFWVVYRVSNDLAGRMELLEQGTIRIAEHDFDIAIHIPGNDEFGSLAKNFMLMASAIRQAHHDLKIAAQRAENVNTELAKSLQWNEAIIASIPDLLLTFDQVGTFLDCHATDDRLLFLPKERFLGKNLADVLPPAAAFKSMHAITTTLDTGELQTFEYGLDLPQAHRWFELRVMRLTGETALAIARDITARKNAEDRLKASLQEKEVLLRELYHRTKNTMQVIRSMLLLQAAKMPDNAQAQKLVKDTENRIMAMALVHQKLYQSQDLSRISIQEYIEELAQMIMQGYMTTPQRIALALDIENMSLLLDTAIPCGLILNELLSNALKYAFPDDHLHGEISIRLSRKDSGRLELVFSDNGAGVPAAFDFRSQDTLGLRTIYAIAEHQMQGQVAFNSEHGVRCTIEFPDTLYTERV